MKFYYSRLLLFLGLLPAVLIANEAERVVIVANSNDSGSVEIAEYYAKQRQIPVENIIALPMPTKETITIREYVDTLYNPLLGQLIDKGWVKGARSGAADTVGRKRMSIGAHSMSYLVTTRGVPLRFANDPQLYEPETANLQKELRMNQGSVDSDLMVMAVPAQLPLTSLLKNPFFEKDYPPQQVTTAFVRVCRLDGPSVDRVLSLIDRTIEAEKRGLRGRAYIDTGAGPNPKGNEWINAAGDYAEAAHFDTDFEGTRAQMNFSHRLDAPAIYMGWYRADAYGPWKEPRWSVPPGAIAFHLHSYSATTVRSSTKRWLGPFVQQGYCATVGNVYEPYMDFTHHPHLMLKHLLAGRTFGEASAYSYPVSSWMGVAIGDPLYRPFKVSLKQQLTELEEGPWASYVIIREVNRRKAEVSAGEALSYARAMYIKYPSLALAYKLAGLHQELGQPRKGVEALKIIRYMSVFPVDERVLVKQIADFLHTYGESEMALEVYEKLVSEKDLGKSLRIVLLEDGSKIAQQVGKRTLASSWGMQARQLKQPPVKPNKG